MTLIEKGHRLDARQAQPYHQLTLWRRMITKSNQIKDAFERVWMKRRANGRENGKGTGPVAVLERTIKELGWSWKEDPFNFQREEKVDLPFLGQEEGWWKHEVQGELRDMIWRNDKAVKARTSFRGCERRVDYEATVKVYREKQSHPRKGERSKENQPNRKAEGPHAGRKNGEEEGPLDEHEDGENEEVEGEKKHRRKRF